MKVTTLTAITTITKFEHLQGERYRHRFRGENDLGRHSCPPPD
jgi:hypothetical protein